MGRVASDVECPKCLSRRVLVIKKKVTYKLAAGTKIIDEYKTVEYICLPCNHRWRRTKEEV